MKARRYSAQNILMLLKISEVLVFHKDPVLLKYKKRRKNVEKSITALKRIYPEAKPANALLLQ